MTEPVDEFLMHYGVKGMRWGKRGTREKPKAVTESRSVELKNGSKLQLEGQKTPLPAKLIAAMSPKFAHRINNSFNYSLKSPDGKKVGDLYLYKKKPDEMNVVWVEVDKKARGQGYASGAINATVELAKQQGLKKVTLEVPGNSPDARHIYEKAGFKVMKEPSKFEAKMDSVWGGLTEMQLDL